MHFQEDSALVSERNKPPRENFVVKLNSTYYKAYKTMKIYAGPLLASGLLFRLKFLQLLA